MRSGPRSNRAQPDDAPSLQLFPPKHTARLRLEIAAGEAHTRGLSWCAACRGNPSPPHRGTSQGAGQINVLREHALNRAAGAAGC